MTTSGHRPHEAMSSPPLRLVPPPRDSNVDDARLVQGLVAEEDWAVRWFWDRYEPVVYGILDRALGGKASESEDLTQEVLLGLFLGVKRLRDPTALRSYVVASTILRLRRHLRWKKVRRFLLLSETGTVPEQLGPDGQGRELLRRLYAMLDTLSADERTAFVLRSVEGFSLLEIVEATGASLATVKRRIRRAASKVEDFARSDPDLARYVREHAGTEGP